MQRSDTHVSKSPRPQHDPNTTQSGSSALVRIGWMVVGSVAMLYAAFSIASVQQWTFGWRDLLLCLGALTCVTLRYLDIRRFDGQTANGEPATMAHFRRYFVGVVVVGLGAWVAAQSVHF